LRAPLSTRSTDSVARSAPHGARRRPHGWKSNSDKFTELPFEGYRGDFPPLPATYAQRTWDGEKHVTKRVRYLPSTRQWYEEWARSPMATEFTTVHWRRLQTIANLQERFDRGDLSVTSELRQGIASFGGSIADLHRMGRTISKAPADSENSRGRRAGSSDRRARLEASGLEVVQ
jgi:hypothetical protein